MKILFRMFGLSILCCCVVSPVNVFSCGPFFTTAVFVEEGKPDYPVKDFMAGSLGIVQPAYSPACQFAAYRYFIGRPLSPEEQELLAEVESAPWLRESPPPAYDDWISVRRQVLGSDPSLQYPFDISFRDEGRNLYLFYNNILEDAFAGAARTLRQRIAQFGAASPVVAQFARAQDQVFMGGDIPLELDTNAAPLARADRSYQIASALFYNRQFDKAESLFAAIGRDGASPWNRTSRYLVARAMIRMATLLASNQDSVLKVAEGYLDEQMRDADMSGYLPAMRRLLSFCMFRTSPEILFRQLDGKIAAPEGLSITREEWNDYATLLRQGVGTVPVARSEFAEWWESCRSGSPPQKYLRALQRYRASKSNAWLIAALESAGPHSKDIAILLRNAAAISRTQSAFATVQYWRVRLLIARNNLRHARSLLDSLLSHPVVPESRSNTNLLRALRVQTARTLPEFLKDSFQQVAGTQWDDGTDLNEDSLSRFTPEARIVNTLFPARLMFLAGCNRALPTNLRSSLLQAAWTRAVLVDEDSTAAQAARVLEASEPQLKPLLREYEAASDPGLRRFMAALILVRNPGLRPSVRIGIDRSTPMQRVDDFRQNWWYAGKEAVMDNLSSNWVGYPDAQQGDLAPNRRLPFLSDDDTTCARRETATLVALPAAATYLGAIITDWARQHPDDKRIPEALYRVIRVSRFGCADRTSREYSKRAFTILHRRYRNSEWTTKSKYWY